MLVLLGALGGSGLVSFLVAVLIIAIVIYAIKLLLDWVALPHPIKAIVWLIVAVIVIFFLLNKFAGVSI